MTNSMSNNNPTNINNISDSWSDNMLVKDNSGSLHRFKNEMSTNKAIVQHSNLSLKIASPASIPTEDKFVAVPSLGHSTQVAKFGFHPEDEQEIQEIINELPEDLTRKYSIEKIVDKLIIQEKLNFKVEFKQKFTDILFDFFRNRRNAIIVRELLSEKILSNEKILSEEQVNNIVSIIKSIKVKIENAGGLVVKMSDLLKNKSKQQSLPKEVLKPEVAALQADLNSQDDSKEPLKSDKTQKEIENLLSDLPVDQLAKNSPESLPEADDNDADLKPLIKTIQKPVELKPKPIVLPKENKKPLPAKIDKLPVQTEVKEALPKVYRQSNFTAVKKPMADVLVNKERERASMPIYSSTPQVKATLTGPIEELQSLNLDSFRRLGDNSSEQIDKLLKKINLLEKDSVTKKAQGIEGWRHSPVYQIYLALGEESLSQGKNVENIIKDKLAKKQETLTIEEFSAISDLNKLLRF